jgi:uncharacterized protein YecA (UPF0149 family)
MNTNTGEIYPEYVVADLPEEARRHVKPMVIPPTPAQRKRGKVGRNDPCPCGSGVKFKKCCFQMSGSA